jgi:acetyl esterase/lipase
VSRQASSPLIPTVFRIIRAILANGQFRPFRHVLARSFLQNAGETVPLKAAQTLLPPTSNVISRYCRSAGLPHRAIVLEGTPPATLHFVGETDRVLLYFHGGGYAHTIRGLGHMPLALDCAKAARASLVLLEYTLTPELRYPGQLRQAVSALKYLKGKEVILAGDSAGGNLVLALLAHLKKPHPEIEPLEMHIRGACMISPWVGIDYNAPSYESNAQKDCLSKEIMLHFDELWRPRHELWAAPVDAPSGFWRDVFATMVDRSIVVVGKDEVFLDDILTFAMDSDSTAEMADGRLRLVQCWGEFHVQAAVDYAFGIKGGLMKKAVLEWFLQLE